MKEYHKGMVEAAIKGDKLAKEELIADLDYIEELENENERLNNIIDELEKDIKNLYTYGIKNNAEQKDYLLNRIDGLRQTKDLKEGKENE